MCEKSIFRFEDAPREIPDWHVKQQYKNMKNFYSLNAMVVANNETIIHVNSTWPGTAHDARVWKRSQLKPVVEQHNNVMIVGDSAYGITEHLAKPYSTRDIDKKPYEARKRKIIRFNTKLCGACTVMTPPH